MTDPIRLSFDDIVHRGNVPFCDAFHILLLCDGFRWNQKGAFRERCEELKRGFFKISPFTALQENIYIWSYFTYTGSQQFPGSGEIIKVSSDHALPMDERISRASSGTRFGFFIGENDYPNTLRVDEPIIFVENLELPRDFDYSVTYSGSDVWCTPEAKSFGAIAILLNTRPELDFNAITKELNDTSHYIALPLYHYRPESANAPASDFHHSFAHELGHAIYGFVRTAEGRISSVRNGLCDEYYHIFDRDIADRDINDPEPPLTEDIMPNLTFPETIFSTSHNTTIPDAVRPNIDKIKWRSIMTLEELQAIRTPTHNPPETVIWKRNETPIRSFLGPTVNDLAAGSIRLVEGGGRYSKGVFRPSFNCKMSENVSSDFCKVCEDHIQRAIGGFNGCELGSRSQSSVKDFIELRGVMRRLVASFQNDSELPGRVTPLALNDSSSEVSARAAARMAFILAAQGRMDLRLFNVIISDTHTYLKYGNIIIDPTFYHLYRDGSSYSYRHSDRTYEINTTEPRVNNRINFFDGFVGNKEELRSHIERYIPSFVRSEEISPQPVFYPIFFDPNLSGYEVDETADGSCQLVVRDPAPRAAGFINSEFRYYFQNVNSRFVRCLLGS